MSLKRNEIPKWRYSFSVKKRTEGGMGAPDSSISKEINRIDGARGQREYSPYVGQSGYVVYARDKKSLRKALKILKEYGYVKDIDSSVRWAERDKQMRDRGFGW